MTEEEKEVIGRLEGFPDEWYKIDKGGEPWKYETEDVDGNWNGIMVGGFSKIPISCKKLSD